jgi:hypothetical protein
MVVDLVPNFGWEVRDSHMGLCRHLGDKKGICIRGKIGNPMSIKQPHRSCRGIQDRVSEGTVSERHSNDKLIESKRELHNARGDERCQNEEAEED